MSSGPSTPSDGVHHRAHQKRHVLRHARRVDTARLPTTERRARYWIDVARAFEQWGKADRCYQALLAAEQAAPQEVRRGAVRSMSPHLMRHDRTLPGVRAFASRVGSLT
ncbi:hypothetical protein KBZ10_27515 [Streptomyces sp. F63]|uniref:hypothetical protein n=1 Tax=Streptomyces sp. F63 TaxID=2824887 RepID=UPI001B39A741|nr:hypothetical protein [Streptomyces sp. F63]MBQ0988193.1 hypothetical protein [Streptomyces sp. F63]